MRGGQFLSLLLQTAGGRGGGSGPPAGTGAKLCQEGKEPQVLILADVFDATGFGASVSPPVMRQRPVDPTSSGRRRQHGTSMSERQAPCFPGSGGRPRCPDRAPTGPLAGHRGRGTCPATQDYSGDQRTDAQDTGSDSSPERPSGDLVSTHGKPQLWV